MRAALRRWWWVPLVVLAVMVLKAWMMTGMMQGSAREAAAKAADIPLEQVAVGQGFDIHMTGFATEAERQAAIEAVEPLDSSWTVTADPIADTAVAEPAAPAVTSAPEPEPAEEAPVGEAPASLVVAVDPDGAVVLTGTVASESVRASLVEAAGAAFGEGNVTDELVIDAEAVAPSGGVVSVTGEAVSQAQQADWLAAATSVARVTELEVVDETTVAEVEDTLNDLFALEPIEFDASRATIRPGSRATLDAAAAVINDNPDIGHLKVVGHTDSDGDNAANQDLSQRRAQAVVEYLVSTADVDPDRLVAEGRGEEELQINPEESADDKQRNRRIEWERLS